MSEADCPHDDKPWRCIPCCLAELRRNVPRLERAVRVREQAAKDGTGSFGSREPINIGALALLQDLWAQGGVDGLEAKANTYRDPEALAALRRVIRQLRSRTSLVLHDALAPYKLLWPTQETVTDEDGTERLVWRDRAIPCPVISEDGTCAGALFVHRDSDPNSAHFSKPSLIVCQHDDTHEWTTGLGWMRLGVLLGGDVGAA